MNKIVLDKRIHIAPGDTITIGDIEVTLTGKPKTAHNTRRIAEIAKAVDRLDRVTADLADLPVDLLTHAENATVDRAIRDLAEAFDRLNDELEEAAA